MLNNNQQIGMEMAVGGHNFILFGSAGTGKSYLVAKIVEELRRMGKTVALTCSTGIACMVYSKNLQAVTIHKFSGLEDGRCGPGEIGNKVRNSVKHSEILSNIQCTDVLVIDEVSMISSRTLQSIEEVMALKNPNKYFGGIQVILCGDFLQLPPVKDIEYGDSGSYCFETPFFNVSFPHRVTLKEVMRQSHSDHQLISAIHEVSAGSELSQETQLFIKSLERPLPRSDIFDINLFSKNELVDDFNRKKIKQFPGQLHEYHACDEGDQRYKLEKMLVPKTLWLKIGIPVILLRNLTSQLVNGLRGFVMDLDNEGPTVEFPGVGITTKLSKYAFEVFSPRLNKNVAVRTQFPVKPAFGLTVHKAQGMTLDRVEVDCSQIFQPGQLAVAMSRTKTTEGIRIVNFHQKYCIKHPQIVMEFLEEQSAYTDKDKKCCRIQNRLETSKYETEMGSSMKHVPDNENITDTEDQFDKDFDDFIIAMDNKKEEALKFTLPEDFKVTEILESIKTENPVSPTQNKVNSILLNVSISKLETFCKHEFAFLTNILEDLNINEPRAVPSKDLNKFYTNVHKHLISMDYRMNCFSVFENSHGTVTDDHIRICFDFHQAVRKYLMKEKTKLYISEFQKISKRFLTVQSKARLRYVSGYCIAKLLFHYSKKKRNHTFSTSEDSETIYEDSVKSLGILNLLKEEEEYLKSYTDDEASLADILKRQNVSRSLTHIPDEIFKFFIKLCERCLKLLVTENLNVYGEKMFSFCLGELLTAKDLSASFKEVIFSRMNTGNSEITKKSVFQTEESCCCYIDKIYNEILKKFLLVFFAQFRKDVKSSYHIEKTLAHRKQIQISKQKKEKANVSKAVTPSTSGATAENIKCQPLDLDEVVPSSSKHGRKNPVRKRERQQTQDTVKKFEGSFMNKEGETIWACPVCGEVEDNTLPMVGCDDCDDWFHWSCVGLTKEPDEEQWFCQDCEYLTLPKRKKKAKKGNGKKSL